MLEPIEPVLCTMNVGNLHQQETAKITYRYAIHLSIGRRSAAVLPTDHDRATIRRIASPAHQAPEASVVCARFDRAPAQGAAILEVKTDKDETIRQDVGVSSGNTHPFPGRAEPVKDVFHTLILGAWTV